MNTPLPSECSINRLDITFKSGNTHCAGWLYLPDVANTDRKVPAVAMAPGIGSLKEMGLTPFAEAIARRGIAVLLFEYRYLGASGGEPREQVVPSDQLEDYRNALTFLSLRPEIDRERLGVWGISFAGGHVLHLGAYDSRVKAVVSLTPAVDMPAVARARAKPEALAARGRAFAEERKRLYAEGTHRYVPLAMVDREGGALMGTETFEWQEAMQKKFAPQFQNRVTFDSVERIAEYAPGLSIARIAPKPLLVILGVRDKVVPADIIRNAYAAAGEPKRLVELDSGHYDIYDGELQRQAADAAVDWFKTHL